MSQAKTMTLDLKRVIPAAPAKVYAAWMDPKQACNPWHEGKPSVLQAKVGGLFYVRMGDGHRVPHFGRILALEPGSKVQHTWMSPYTRGMESTVTVGFKKHAGGTLMTLRHAGLPNDSFGRAHSEGWGYFLGMVEGHFAAKK
jgi:uncharacterized protein YndB with AHSA1/START domain